MEVSLLIDFGTNFFENVWVFLIEILGFFCLLVSSKILGGFSKLIYFRVSFFKFFLVRGFFFRDSSEHTQSYIWNLLVFQILCVFIFD